MCKHHICRQSQILGKEVAERTESKSQDEKADTNRKNTLEVVSQAEQSYSSAISDSHTHGSDDAPSSLEPKTRSLYILS